MKTYHTIAVLGYGFTPDWQLPPHVYPRLKQVAELYQEGVAPQIVVCGKWSVNWDLQGITPPTTEAELMKKELLKLGVPETAIIKEEYSQDTIGNLFFLKTHLLGPHHYRKILIVCANFHLKRVQFLVEKIFTPPYEVELFPTTTEKGKDPTFMQLQDQILERQQTFLAAMQKGEDSFLATRLYSDPYYQQKRPPAMAAAAMGKTS